MMEIKIMVMAEILPEILRITMLELEELTRQEILENSE